MTIEYRVEIMELQSPLLNAQVGTTESNIVIVGHGLVALDGIINATIRTAGTDPYGNSGARQVYDIGLDADNIPLATPIVGMVDSNLIRPYKYVNRTGLLVPGSFRLMRKAKGESTLEFQIKTSAAYLLCKGQNVRVKCINNAVVTYVFWGCVVSHEEELIGAGQTVIMQKVGCSGAGSIAARRTIEINETEGATCGSIVTKMLDRYLFSEGIRGATIETGALLSEDWDSDVISIKEVLDTCAEKSGFPWYINDEGLLYFHDQASVSDSTHELDESGYSNYFNLRCSTNSSEYFNKYFFAGGVDESQNDIVIVREDLDEIEAVQDIIGGTGAFGMVVRDTSLTESDYKTAESGSTTTTINLTSHGQEVGDMVFNWTRGEYRTILTKTANSFTVAAFSGVAGSTADTAEAGTNTTNIKITAHGLSQYSMIHNITRSAYRSVSIIVDADNIIVDAIPGQTTGDSLTIGGDIIGLFDDINKVLAEKQKKQSIDPTTLTFKTPDVFYPDTKLHIILPSIGHPDSYFLIEDVEIVDLGAGLENCWYNVKATRRNNASFSTHRKISYRDYWRDM